MFLYVFHWVTTGGGPSRGKSDDHDDDLISVRNIYGINISIIGNGVTLIYCVYLYDWFLNVRCKLGVK